MERADAGKGIGLQVVGDKDVAHLGMDEPVDQAPVHQAAAADARYRP